MRALKETSSSITVQWEPVKCIHRNGDIIQYRVRYEAEENAQSFTAISHNTEITITALDMSTNYTIEVAAETNAGVGIYSAPFNASTDGEYIKILQICRSWTDNFYISLQVSCLWQL